MRIRKRLIGMAIAATLCAAPAVAQERHITDTAAMQKAIAQHKAVDDNNREAVMTVLRRPDVKQLAERMGLSLQRAETALASLPSDKLAELAEPARAVSADLAGGDTKVVISLTALLLLLILIVLLVK
ncbi:MAG TPA: hypothetical protein VFV98_17575 [Vicinamibacterales bacterium]|nr:hypothetical protein [Vicinamibacterales bacterium]